MVACSEQDHSSQQQLSGPGSWSRPANVDALDLGGTQQSGVVESRQPPSEPAPQSYPVQIPQVGPNQWGGFGRPIRVDGSLGVSPRGEESLNDGINKSVLGPSVGAAWPSESQHSEPQSQSQTQELPYNLLPVLDEGYDLPDVPDDGGQDPELWDDDFLSEILTQMTQTSTGIYSQHSQPIICSGESPRSDELNNHDRTTTLQSAGGGAQQPGIGTHSNATPQNRTGGPEHVLCRQDASGGGGSSSQTTTRRSYPSASLSPRQQLAERAASVRQNAVEAPLDGFAEARVIDQGSQPLPCSKKRSPVDSCAGESCKKCAKLESALGKVVRTVTNIEKKIVELGKVCSRTDRKQTSIQKTCSQVLSMSCSYSPNLLFIGKCASAACLPMYVSVYCFTCVVVYAMRSLRLRYEAWSERRR